jgi:hypothetical protein
LRGIHRVALHELPAFYNGSEPRSNRFSLYASELMGVRPNGPKRQLSFEKFDQKLVAANE